MQSVNNDMDDLFRRAAENYPLRTDGADWNKVMQGLEPGRRETLPQRIKSLERYFWMAAIFLVVICTTFIQKTEQVVQPGNNAAENNTSAAIPGGQGAAEKAKPIEEPSSVPGSEKNNIVSSQGSSMVHKEKPQKASSSLAGAKRPFLIPSNETTGVTGAGFEIQELNHRPRIVEVERNTEKPGYKLSSGNNMLLARNRIASAKIGKEQIVPTDHESAKNMKNALAHKFYAGFVAGPDVSSVKSQKIGHAGYSIGLLAGYQFNRRLSLETGILWDKKDYYSSGKHFNKGGLGLPQHAKILYVDGYCNMFEIPLNLKFNWSQKSKHNLFATAGVSSYLMNKEKYEYAYDYYGTQYNYYKQYNNASRNWVSIMNLSLGFEKKIGNAGAIRVEPYFKLPLKGVGIGELPIGSKGILVGFTRPIR